MSRLLPPYEIEFVGPGRTPEGEQCAAEALMVLLRLTPIRSSSTVPVIGWSDDSFLWTGVTFVEGLGEPCDTVDRDLELGRGISQCFAQRLQGSG